MVYCKNCGAQLAAGARFCAVCGTPTGLGAPEQPQASGQPVGQGMAYQPQAEQAVPEQPVGQEMAYQPQPGQVVPEQPVGQGMAYQPQPGQPYPNGQPVNMGQPYPNGQPVNMGQPYPNGQPVNMGQPYPNGQPVNGGQPYQGAPYAPGYDPLGRYGNPMPQKKNKTAGIVMAVIGLIAIAAIVLLIVLITGGDSHKSYKNAVNTFMRGYVNQDLDQILEAVLPDMREDAKDEIMYGYDSEAEMWADMNETMEWYYGANVKMSYQITDAEQLDEYDLEDCEEMLEEWYGYECRVTDGYSVEVEVTYRGSENKDTEDVELAAIKIKGKWYVVFDF